MKKKPNHGKLVDLAIQETSSARAAFDLAHRARRLLERAAETASRDRWDEIGASPHKALSNPEAAFAAACAGEAIECPVVGEAAVYAALLDAVDTAHIVADRLYDRFLATQRTEQPVPIEGVNRIGAPLAPGCSRGFCPGSSDEDFAS